MKGLILKDFYMALKYCRAFLFIVVIFLGVSFYGNNSLMFIAYPCLLTSIIPVTLISYDEHSRWDIFSQTLPYTRAQLVSAKYILGLIFSAVSYILSVAVLTVKMYINDNFGTVDLLLFSIIIMIISLFCPAFLLPFVFKFGTEKGRIVYLIICGAFAAMLAFFSNNLYQTPSKNILSTSILVPLLIVLAVIVVIYSGSWLLSISFYKKREF